jgi:predicted GTPase
MENKRIAIIGNPSVGTISALRTHLPECEIIVVDKPEPKVDTSKYEQRFRKYRFVAYAEWRGSQTTIADILCANGINRYEDLVREYKLIKLKTGKLPYKARLAVCQVYEQVHKD